MSYILDALRKSEQQRCLGDVPTLATAAATPVPPETPVVVARSLLGVFLIVVMVTAIIGLRPSTMEMVASGSVAAPPELPGLLMEASTAKSDAQVVAPVAVVVAADERGKGLAKSAEDEMPRGKILAESSKPAPMRKTLPVMLVAVHAYSSKPEERIVSINGQLLKEGDALGAGLILEQITPDGMIFDYRGKRIQRKAR
jgi:general secretion pathway protein B